MAIALATILAGITAAAGITGAGLGGASMAKQNKSMELQKQAMNQPVIPGAGGGPTPGQYAPTQFKKPGLL